MEPVKPQMSRTTAINKPLFKPVQVSDTRFGSRTMFLNQNDKPQAFSYANPGRHWWGTR